MRGFPGDWKLPPLRLPSRDGSPSLALLSLFLSYILSHLLSKTMGCFSGRLMSSARDQKLFCEVCSAFNCSFHEFVGEKVVSPSYSSAILVPPPFNYILTGGKAEGSSVSVILLLFTTALFVDHRVISLVAQSCLTLCDPMDCSTPSLPVHHQVPEFTQTQVQ